MKRPIKKTSEAGRGEIRGDRARRVTPATSVRALPEPDRAPASDSGGARGRAATSDAGELAEHVRELLRLLGEDPQREGLLKTPSRVEKSLLFLTNGYRRDVAEIVNGAIFEEPTDEMVVVKNIDLYSLCEHHLLPFYGKAHVAYLPKGRIIGLSKIPRIVDAFARRLQVQERLTTQIAECLSEHLRPRGVAVVIEAYHLCMAMRGVEKQNAFATTSAMLGAFRDDRGTRAEFLEFLNHRR
jgi:GTP cyclohydrolase I